MESTFQEYQAFSERTLEEKDLPMFVAAKKKLESLLPFENQLVRCSHTEMRCEIVAI